MSYTPPAGNAANLKLAGSYVVPVGNEANLSLVSGPPTTVIVGRTTLSLVAVGNLASAFSASGSTSSYFEQPYRAVAISGSSSAAFVTDQRNLDISLASTPLFRAGFRAVVETGSTLSAQLWATARAQTQISGATTFSYSWRSEFNTSFSSVGKSFVSGAAVFNKPFVFYSLGKTSAIFRRNAITLSSVSIAAASEMRGKAAAFAASDFGCSGGAAASFVSRYAVISSVSFSGVSTVNASGVPSVQSLLQVNGSTLPAFVSSQGYSEVSQYDPDEDMVFVLAKPQQSVYVMAP